MQTICKCLGDKRLCNKILNSKCISLELLNLRTSCIRLISDKRLRHNSRNLFSLQHSKNQLRVECLKTSQKPSLLKR